MSIGLHPPPFSSFWKSFLYVFLSNVLWISFSSFVFVIRAAYKFVTFWFLLFTGQTQCLKYSDIGIWDHDFDVQYVSHLVSNPIDQNQVFSNGYAMLQFAKLAYESDNVVREVVEKKAQFQNYNVIHLWGTDAYICSKENNIFVFFRGTEPFNVYEWLTDSAFRFRLLRNPNSFEDDNNYRFVHSGFMDALDVNGFNKDAICTWLQVVECISKFANIFKNSKDNERSKIQNPRIFITGHSLGAALATLFTQKLIEIGLTQHIGGLYTFGSPRTGNDAFKNHFEKEMPKNVFRFVYAEDIVTRLVISTKDPYERYDIHAENPFSYRIAYWIISFFHATEEYYHLGERCKIERTVALSRIERILPVLIPIIDHAPINYHKALGKYKKSQ